MGRFLLSAFCFFCGFRSHAYTFLSTFLPLSVASSLLRPRLSAMTIKSNQIKSAQGEQEGGSFDAHDHLPQRRRIGVQREEHLRQSRGGHGQGTCAADTPVSRHVTRAPYQPRIFVRKFRVSSGENRSQSSFVGTAGVFPVEVVNDLSARGVTDAPRTAHRKPVCQRDNM